MVVHLSVIHLRDCFQMPRRVRALRFEQLFVLRRGFAAGATSGTRGTHKQLRSHGFSEPEPGSSASKSHIVVQSIANPGWCPKLDALDVNRFLQKISFTTALFRSN